MAVLDVERNAIVIRIVYDGPPEAGKTSSLRALSASLARPMTTPAEEAGRTVYFDWMEYTGGLFEGRQIRCQIVTVPGQTALAQRRHALLETADVVLFVSDSAPGAIEATHAYMREMREVLDGVSGPPVGVIVQANKRDLADAVPLAAIRERVDDARVAILESVALESRGVREAFVFAVRLALDRVRELLRLRTLPSAPPDVETSADLLRQLQGRTEAQVSVAQEAFAETPPLRTPGDGTPLPPDHTVPAGMIWPPVEGRVLLLDACAKPFVARQTAHEWLGEAGQWKFQSPRGASYADIDAGRRALIDWARVHALGQRWFSSPRVLALAADGHGLWRLWQIVKAEPSLRDRLLRDADRTPRAFLRRLLDAGRVLLAATESLPLAPCRLPITTSTLGERNGTPMFVSFLPGPVHARTAYAISAEHRAAVLRRELGALASVGLRDLVNENFPPLHDVVRHTDPPSVVDAVQDVLQTAGL